MASSSKKPLDTPKKQTSESTGIRSNSTPLSRGTASDSEWKMDDRATDANLALLSWDLRDAMHVQYSTMIKTLIQLKAVREDENAGISYGDTQKLERYGEEQYLLLLKEAVAFCNNEEGRDSSPMKVSLAAALKESSEKARYCPLVAAFNHVLSQYRGKKIGTLENPEPSDDFIFVTNEPDVPGSEPFSPATTNTSKRRPDIIDLRIEDLCWLIPERKDFSYDDWADSAQQPADKEKENLSKWRKEAKKEGRHFSWCHLSTCFEIKANRGQAYFKPKLDKLVYDFEDMKNPGRATATQSRVSNLKPAIRRSATPSSTGVPTTSRAGSEVRSASSLKKRKPDDQAPIMGPPPPKKPNHGGILSNDTATSQSVAEPEQAPPPRMTPENQCAHYAAELTRSVPDRTHCIVFLLTDNNLCLRYYDAQGCIVTYPIDIVEQLPYLVATLILFQRFKSRMRGRAHHDFEATIKEKKVKFGIPLYSPARWELRGRRPVTAVPVPRGFEDVSPRPAASKANTKPPVGDDANRGEKQQADDTAPDDQTAEVENPTTSEVQQPEATPLPLPPKILRSPGRASTREYEQLLPGEKALFEELEPYFLKVSWRERSRDPEGYIIEQARERAEAYLGANAKAVTDHIPQVIGYGEFERFETGLVRRLLDPAWTLFNSRSQPRIPSWTLMKRLVSFNELDPKDFEVRFWEIIRCHFLLWKIGVAHGDVSFSNLMLLTDDGKTRAVLNDFDLAALMTPGSASPIKKGSERTGTKPFMAYELLTRQDAVARVYRHDLESIAWCMVWYCQERLEWTGLPHAQVASTRVLWYESIDGIPEGSRPGMAKYWNAIMQVHSKFIRWWTNQHNTSKWGEEDEYAAMLRRMTDKEFVGMVRASLPCPVFVDSWAWIDFEVLEISVRSEDVIQGEFDVEE